MHGRYIRNNRGAVTVFLAIVFLAIIVFAGVIIDIARIAAAEGKVEQALYSSARSVLAGYDRELAGDYGIFALNVNKQAKDELYKYLKVNLREYHRGFSFLDIDVTPSDVELLGGEAVVGEEAFKAQVMEYMKYRVPIIASQSVIEQLKNLKLDKKTAFAESEKATREKARELRGKVNDLNGKLEDVRNKLPQLSAGKLRDIKNTLEEALSLDNEIFLGGDQSLIEEYRKSLNETNQAAGEAQCIENLSEEFDDIAGGQQEVSGIIERCFAEVSSTLDTVEPMMRELTQLKNEIRRLKDKEEDLSGEIAELRQRAEELQQSIDEETAILRSRLERYGLKGYSLRDERQQLPAVDPGGFLEYIRETEKAVKDKLVAHIDRELLIPIEEFNEAAENSEFLFNTSGAYESTRPDIGEEEAERRNDTILENLNKLIQVVNDAAAGTMEKAYLIEYVMDKYTFLTSKTDRVHHFRKGEVEYILAGNDSVSNYSELQNTEYFVIGKVLLQIWTLRFALDVLDSFINSTVVFPPQRLAFALTEGALDASMDMFNLLNGEAIPITPKSFTAVKLKYSDHLRILLYM